MNLDVHLGVLLPVLIPAAAALILLALNSFSDRLGTLHTWLAAAAAVAAAAASATQLVTGGQGRGTFCLGDGSCLYQVDRATSSLQLLVLVVAAIVAALTVPLPTEGADRGPQAVLLLAATTGAVALPAARDVITLIVAFCLMLWPLAAMVALRGRSVAVHGADGLIRATVLSTATLALGGALWVFGTGTALLDAATMQAGWQESQLRPVLAVALLLLLAGLGSALTLVPFHLWAPTTLVGASLPVAAVLAVAVRAATFGGVIVAARAMSVAGRSALTVLAVLAVVSITVGLLLALTERDTVRMLAWSGVAQTGWALLPLATRTDGAAKAAVTVVVVGSVATLALFAALTLVAHAEGRQHVRRLDDLRGTLRARPIAGVAVLLAALTLAGIPPALGGLVAKVAVLNSVVQAHLWPVLVLAGLNIVLGLAVYLRLAWAVTGRRSQASVAEHAAPLHGVLVALMVLLLVVVNLAPQLITEVLLG